MESLNPHPPKGVSHQTSLTHQWIEENWADASPKIQAYLNVKLPWEDRATIEDHVNNFALILIRNKSLDKHLSGGGTIYVSKLKQWALGKARNEQKKWGRDAHQRTIGPYRTVAERRDQKELPEQTVNLNSQAWVRVSSGTNLGRLIREDFGNMLGLPDLIEERIVLKDFLTKFKDVLLSSAIESEQELWDVFQQNILGEGSMKRKHKKSIQKKIVKLLKQKNGAPTKRKS